MSLKCGRYEHLCVVRVIDRRTGAIGAKTTIPITGTTGITGTTDGTVEASDDRQIWPRGKPRRPPERIKA
jgi:hypothetical protein